jgi:hypothetical protein
VIRFNVRGHWLVFMTIGGVVARLAKGPSEKNCRSDNQDQKEWNPSKGA